MYILIAGNSKITVLIHILFLITQGCAVVGSRIFMYTCSTDLVFSAWESKHAERCCNLLECTLATFSPNVFQWSSETCLRLPGMVEIGRYEIPDSVYL